MTRVRRTALLVAAVAFVVLAGAALGGVLRDRSEPAADSRRQVPAGGRAALEALGITPPAATLSELADEARRDPSAPSLARYGLASLQSVRETGDPAGYARAEAALERAAELDARSYPALVGLATLAAARHEFQAALRYAERAHRVQPASTEALGIRGDAELELGRYRKAFATFDEMSARKPSVASYTRVAYGRELSGDRRGAIEAMSLAVDASSGSREPRAFALVQRGNLHLADDALAEASRDYTAALRSFPTYAPALAGQARVAYAQGRVDRAVRLYERAIEIVPLPEFAIALGEVLEASGRRAAAVENERLVEALATLQRENGVQLDLELATYQLDTGRDVAGSLRTIERVFEERPSIHVEDALAWGLVKAGRCAEARRHSARALRLGTRDGLMMFHRAEAERCLGNGPAARDWYRRALAANPNFSIRHLRRATDGAAR